MGNLIEFIKRLRFTFLFIFFQIVCLFLLINGSGYQQASLINSANEFSGWVYTQESKLRNYVDLEDRNRKLTEENAYLKKKALRNYQIISRNQIKVINKEYRLQYDYLPATIIRTSRRDKNYIVTLNAGTQKGVEKEMAVVSRKGVVGFVKDVSNNYCTVITALNKHFSISVKKKGLNYTGTYNSSLYDPFNSGSVYEMPAASNLKKGDTLVTSTGEGLFSEGETVGYVTEVKNAANGNYLEAKLKLAQDFNDLGDVYIVRNAMKHEMDSLVAKP